MKRIRIGSGLSRLLAPLGLAAALAAAPAAQAAEDLVLGGSIVLYADSVDSVGTFALLKCRGTYASTC